MRITIVTGPFNSLPPAPCGAVERVWHDLGREFAAQGHVVTFISRAVSGLAPVETAGNLTYIRRTSFRHGYYLGWNLVKDLFYSARMLPLLPPADILVTNTFWMPVIAPRLKRGAGKVVVNVQRMPKGQMRFYLKAARLAACSRAVRDEILRQCPKAFPLAVVIANPIDTSVFKPPAKPRSPNGVRTILYIGRLHPEKGLHVLIPAFAEVFRRNQNTRLRLVGPVNIEQGGGGKCYFEHLRSLAADLPVEFVEPVFDKAKLAEIYQSAHVFCYPSLAEKGEASPLAPLEAMGTGLIPVVSDLLQFRDYLTANETGLVFNHRAAQPEKELAVMFARALDSQTMETMGAKAAAAAAQFSVQCIARSYLDEFECLLKNRPA